MGGLTLLHPWLLAGLAAASLPILIHLIGRRRAPTVFFAAFDFLMAVNKRLARRERIRQLLLLVLRTLAIVALVLAVTRPLPPRPAAASTAARHLALVIDTSASMRYRAGGTTLLERAKDLARDALSHLQPGDTVTVVAAGPTVRALTQAPSADVGRARAAVDGLEVASGTADLGAAMDAALAQYGARASGVALMVVTDLAENSFVNVRPTALDPAPEVRLVDAAERERPVALDNLAIEGVVIEPGAGSPAERRLRVLVRNHGAEAVSGRGIEVLLDGEVRLRGLVEAPARGVQEKIFTYGFPGPGVYDGEARLARDERDGYDADDRALFGVEVVPGVRVLAVDGDVSSTPYEDELFFLERALSTVPRGEAPIELRIVSADELAAADLAGFEVVILANVGSLPEEVADRLARFVADGGGLLVTLGDKVQFERANAVLGALLAHPLRDVHQADDPGAGTPPLGIGAIDWDHPIMRPLGPATEESLRASRTSRYFNLDTGADRRTRAVLRFENGAPALVESRREGKGRVMLLTTSVDRDMSDLVLRSAFPAIVQRAVRYLAKAVEGGGRVAIRQGGTAELPVPTGVEAVALVSPQGERRGLEPAGPNRVVARSLADVGFYRAEVERQGSARREPRLDVAVSASLDESDFAPVSPAAVSAALGKGPGGKAVEVALGASGDGDPFDVRGLGSLLLLSLAFFFVGESLLASRG